MRMCDAISSTTAGRCEVTPVFDSNLFGASGDVSVMSHIFSNLLSNAIKYSPTGSRVSHGVTRGGQDARFVVADGGCRIPAADQSRLFEAFHRGSNVENTQGTGLGLVIVRRCLE